MNNYERTGWLIKELPAYQGNNHLSESLYNCGPYMKEYGNETSNSSVMQNITSTSIEEFLTYIDILKKSGFQEEGSLFLEDNYFYRFVRENQRVFANYFGNSKKTMIVLENQKGINPKEISYTYVPKQGEYSEVYMFGLKMDPRGMNRKVPENTSGFVNNGASMIIKCADNSVIIIDGGDERQMEADDRERFYNLLCKITGTKAGESITISAWFITHVHNDHVSGLCRAIQANLDRYQLERVICNAPNPASVQYAQENMYQMTTDLLQTYFPNCQEIKVHTGDVLHVADLKLTVVYTHEDMVDENGVFPCPDFNATSTVVMAEAASGMKFFITGDINEMAEDVMCSHFTGKTLKCDILQQPHHNFNDNKLVYEYGDTHVMLMTQASGGLIKNEMMTAHSNMAKKWCREWYCGGDETVGFSFEDGRVNLIYHTKDICFNEGLQKNQG